MPRSRLMADALDAYRTSDGIHHNIAFLAAVMSQCALAVRAAVRPHFIDEEYPDGFHGTQPSDGQAARGDRGRDPAARRRAGGRDRRPDERPRRAGRQRLGSLPGGRPHPVTVTPGGDGRWRVATGHGEVEVQTDWTHGSPLFHAQLSGRPMTVQVDRVGARWRLTHGGASVEARVLARTPPSSPR
ncbi:MAG: hypothetical protein U5L06_04290 [Rhodovibrio sp.]|nr:hypothetical protein [Rhodovibrio sp.]